MTTFKIGDLAEKTGATIATIRYYESVGLIPAPPRSENGQRMYADVDVRRIRFVRRCRELGFTIEEVRGLVGVANDELGTCVRARELALRNLKTVLARIEEFRALAEELAALARQCDAQCAEGPGVDCTMLQGMTALARNGASD